MGEAHLDHPGDWSISVRHVCDALRPLATIAPSLRLKVHCGGDFENTRCVATITVEDGRAFEGPPEVETVPGVSMTSMTARLARAAAKAGP